MIYDKDGSESLDVAETGQLLRALGMTPTFVQGDFVAVAALAHLTRLAVREIIRDFDKDKNGTLSFEEFLNLYAKHKAPAASSKELLEAFKVFDTAGNGKIRRVWCHVRVAAGAHARAHQLRRAEHGADDAGRSAAGRASEGAHQDARQGQHGSHRYCRICRVSYQSQLRMN